MPSFWNYLTDQTVQNKRLIHVWLSKEDWSFYLFLNAVVHRERGARKATGESKGIRETKEHLD